MQYIICGRIEELYYYLSGNEMASLREVFTENLKKKRRFCGFSQAKLAEMTEVSTHHIAMIEIGRNFPTTELIERMASALNIEAYELFVNKNCSTKSEFEQLRCDIKGDIQQLLADFLEKTGANNKMPRKKNQK